MAATKRVVLVTGGMGGLGEAICKKMAATGNTVVTTYSPSNKKSAEWLAEMKAEGFTFHAYPVDVTSDKDCAALIAKIVKDLGAIDVLVNNAGIAIIRGIDDLTEEEFDTTIAVNLKSAFLCTKAALPHMRAQGWGRIVNISSGAARGAGGVGLHYNASKAGMEGLTRGYAARLVKDGITVNAVSPSLIETDMVRSGVASSPARIPMGRFGTGKEVAQAVLMAIGNGYMTGQTIQLNGGMSFI